MPAAPRIRLAAACLAMASLLPLPALAQDSRSPKPIPAPAALARSLTFAVIARGLSQPVGLVTAPGDRAGRLFVIEKSGTVRILRGGRGVDPPFLDLRGKVSTGMEQGLLGLAFHPQYARNGRLYVNYTDRRGNTHVTGFRVDPTNLDRVAPTSAKDLFVVDQPYANHNGGHLIFGPDGRLYVGLGDGGSGNDPHGNGQNRGTRLAKMLQVDVDKAPGQPAIFQTGLRNPWQYTFDRRTGDQYIADVGQNRFEEINVVPAGKIGGQNFGWSIVEGIGHCLKGTDCNQQGLTQPVLEYDHDDGCSITGGLVYRGKAIPELDGLYFYSDFCTAFIRSFRWQGGKVQDSWDWTASLNPNRRIGQITAFGEDAAGELYVVSLDGNVAKLQRRPR